MDLSITSLFLFSLKTLLLISILFLTLLYLWTKSKHDYWKKRNVKFVKPWPIIGDLTFVMRQSVNDYFKELSTKFKDDYYGIFLGHKPVLVVQTPELARRIFVKDSDCFRDRYTYVSASDTLGSLNLFTVKDPIWSTMRRECSPMFTAARLKVLAELMNINAKALVHRIDRDHVKDNKDVSLKDLFSMYTSDSVAYNVFGLRTSVLSGEDSPLWFITKNMVKWTFSRGLQFTVIFFLPVLSELFNMTFFSDDATDYVRKLFWKVVADRREMNSSKDKDLVNHLLKIKDNMKLPSSGNEKLADDLMLAQAAVFIFGSVETSSTTLSYALMELAHQPDKQEILYQELKDASDKSGRDFFDYDELMQMRYLTSCMLETLRKHIPLAYLDRECNRDYKVDENLTITKGTPVYINAIAIHHNEKYYPEPEKWIPERFTGENESDNRQFTFIPFGEGPRFCIGKRYGMLQVRAALAQVILNYKVLPVTNLEELKPDPYSVILSPIDGGKVKFVARN